MILPCFQSARLSNETILAKFYCPFNSKWQLPYVVSDLNETRKSNFRQIHAFISEVFACYFISWYSFRARPHLTLQFKT